MVSMFPDRGGKISFPEAERIEMFRFIKREIPKHFDWPIDLCKESSAVLEGVGVNLGDNSPFVSPTRPPSRQDRGPVEIEG